jgi:hypothetical protein
MKYCVYTATGWKEFKSLEAAKRYASTRKNASITRVLF